MEPSERAVQTVLSFLREHDIYLQSTNVAKNVGYSHSYSRDILKWCHERDLVEKDDEGHHPFYRITDLGRRYLDDEMTMDDMWPGGFEDGG